MTKNKINPLEELRREKEIVRREVAESEGRLADHWLYLSDNAMPLILHSTINGISGMLGLGFRIGQKNIRREKEETEAETGSTGIIQSLYNNLVMYCPLVWEIAKPMLIRFAIRKIKSLFTRKKNKKRKDDDD